jgi:hypothetical protein
VSEVEIAIKNKIEVLEIISLFDSSSLSPTFPHSHENNFLSLVWVLLIPH